MPHRKQRTHLPQFLLRHLHLAQPLIRQRQQFILLSRQFRQAAAILLLSFFEAQRPGSISRAPLHDGADGFVLHVEEFVGGFGFGAEGVERVEEVVEAVYAG